jgi:hypothetical protein
MNLFEYQEARVNKLEDAMQRIADWADAYPLEVFPELDNAYLKTAQEALQAHGITLDRLSASAMRHVITQVARIAREALEP